MKSAFVFVNDYSQLNSPLWVAQNASKCEEELLKYCRLSCRICGNFTVEVEELEESKKGFTRLMYTKHKGYDLRNVPPNLHKVAFLIGRWKSDFGGKAGDGQRIGVQNNFLYRFSNHPSVHIWRRGSDECKLTKKMFKSSSTSALAAE